MRILQINKFFWVSGGPERYMFDLTALLESKGHEVAHFSMQDPRNRPSPWSKFFVSGLDYRGVSVARGMAKAGRILGGTVYSFEARSKLRALLREFRPDVAHLHLIDHHLSPSILHALREAGVPVVQTIHDYKLVCPNYQLYVPQKNEICERCLPGKFYHCLGRRCMKNSLAASLLVTGAMYLHKALGLYEHHVRAFLCPSEFLREKLAQGGAPREKLRTLPLYVNLGRFPQPAKQGDRMVYAGRLVKEKGVGTLLRAMKGLPAIRLALLGEGASRGELENEAHALGLSNVEFAGFQDGDAYGRALAEARALVLPSEIYDIAPLVAWDANAVGVPVIGARIGGIPEAVVEGETGLLFTPGDATELGEKIRWMSKHPAEAAAMGARGRARVEATCSAHYDRLMDEYARAIGGAGS